MGDFKPYTLKISTEEYHRLLQDVFRMADNFDWEYSYQEEYDGDIKQFYDDLMLTKKEENTNE